MTTSQAVAASEQVRREARVTGLFYLAMGVSGMLAFLWLRPALFSADEATATLANVLTRGRLARAAVVIEMATVLTQLLVALWFFRLFRSLHDFAAAAIATFGIMNAVSVLGSAICLATTLQVADAPSLAPAVNVQLLYFVSENCWRVGNLFFGAWLVPMGWCVIRSGWMPRGLGWTLIAGGGGYVLSVLVGLLVASAGPAIALLVVPATVGEFWMIGYLLTKGVRTPAA